MSDMAHYVVVNHGSGGGDTYRTASIVSRRLSVPPPHDSQTQTIVQQYASLAAAYYHQDRLNEQFEREAAREGKE